MCYLNPSHGCRMVLYHLLPAPSTPRQGLSDAADGRYKSAQWADRGELHSEQEVSLVRWMRCVSVAVLFCRLDLLASCTTTTTSRSGLPLIPPCVLVCPPSLSCPAGTT